MPEPLSPNPKFMQQAIDLATENVLSGAGGPFGAVIVRDGVVLATGANCVIAEKDPTAHAEITAIRKACLQLGAFELRGCHIYSSCEPCPMCLTAILWARLDALFFACTAGDAAEAGFDDSRFYAEVAKPFADRDIPIANLLRQEGIKSFDAWRDSPNRIVY